MKVKRHVYREPKHGARSIAFSTSQAVAVFDSITEAQEWIQNQQKLAANDPYIFVIDPPELSDDAQLLKCESVSFQPSKILIIPDGFYTAAKTTRLINGLTDGKAFRYTIDEVRVMTSPMTEHIEKLEKEIEELKQR